MSVNPPHTTTLPSGPALAETGSASNAIYRSLNVNITLRGGRVRAASVTVGNRNGSVRLMNSPRVVVRLQPVFMPAANHRSRGGVNVDLIVVHHTGGSQISGALSWFMKSAAVHSAAETMTPRADSAVRCGERV